MKSFLSLIFFSLVVTCSSCENAKVVELTITNRTNSVIDSVLFPLTNIKWETIEPGKFKKAKIDLSNVDASRKGMLPLLIFQGSKKIEWSWALHDFGQFSDKESYFLFDNGININDQPLVSPKVLTVALINKSNSKIDSIVANSLISYREHPTFYKIELNFTELQKNPTFIIYQNTTPIKVLVEHDWNNWNNTQEILYLYKNGMVSKEDSL
jgi:hypothetical protein